MKKLSGVLAGTILVFTGLANAQIYKSVDENGVVTFSDKPPTEQQETVETIQTPAQVNRMQAVSVPSTEAIDNSDEEVVTDQTLRIVLPSDNATIPMGAGIFDVRIETSPELDNGETVELYLDEERVGDPQTDLEWTLSYVIRGAHQIQAKRLAADGSLVGISDPITVFVLRPSVL